MAKLFILAILVGIITLSQTETVSDEPKRIDDGLIILPAGEMVTQGAQWGLLVTIDKPKIDKELNAEMDRIYKRMLLVTKTMKIEYTLKNQLAVMVDAMKLKVNQETETLQSRRNTRSLFGFVGTALHYLTGIPDENEIKECKTMIEKLGRSNNQILHHTEGMMTMINHSATHINLNRDHILEVRKVTDNLIQVVQNLSVNDASMTYKFKQLFKSGYLTEAYLGLQFLYNSWLRQLHHYEIQRNNLELGYLTEEILPKAQLRLILNKATGLGLSALQEEYYYQFIRVNPLWEEPSRLVFMATIPLIDNTKYIRYTILSFKIPGSAHNTSIQLETEGDIAIDTRSGEMFFPNEKQCFGYKPTICHHQTYFRGKPTECYKGLINGNKVLRKQCRVTISFKISETEIHSVGINSYLINTPGEIVYLNCNGQNSKTFELEAGLFLFNIQETCQLQGDAWRVAGVIKRKSNMHENYEPLHINPFNLPNLTNTPVVGQHIDNIHWSEVSPPLNLPIHQLSNEVNSMPFQWGSHIKHVSWFNFIFAMVGIGLIVGVGGFLMFRFKVCNRLGCGQDVSVRNTTPKGSRDSCMKNESLDRESFSRDQKDFWGRCRKSFKSLYPKLDTPEISPTNVGPVAETPSIEQGDKMV